MRRIQRPDTRELNRIESDWEQSISCDKMTVARLAHFLSMHLGLRICISSHWNSTYLKITKLTRGRVNLNKNKYTVCRHSVVLDNRIEILLHSQNRFGINNVCKHYCETQHFWLFRNSEVPFTESFDSFHLIWNYQFIEIILKWRMKYIARFIEIC